jgi:hypothetical protein
VCEGSGLDPMTAYMREPIMDWQLLILPGSSSVPGSDFRRVMFGSRGMVIGRQSVIPCRDRSFSIYTRRRNIAPSHQILRPIYSSAPCTDRRYDISSVTQSNLIQSILEHNEIGIGDVDKEITTYFL